MALCRPIEGLRLVPALARVLAAQGTQGHRDNCTLRPLLVWVCRLPERCSELLQRQLQDILRPTCSAPGIVWLT